MKQYKFIGMLKNYERLNCSVNGNPAFYGEFENAAGETLKGRTSSDAACAYGFLNYYKEFKREITYHFTKSGAVHFDYIKILEDVKND